VEALKVERLTMEFGGFRALGGLSVAVEAGERRAVIGPNGAGKTTLFNCVGGTLRPTAGRVFLFGEEVTGFAPFRLAKRGLGRTFQRTSLFPTLSAFENVRLAAQAAAGTGHAVLTSIDRFPEVDRRAAGALEAVGLAEVAAARVGELSHGEQRQLELAVALATGPRLLLLDEPTAGLSPTETARMSALLKALPRDLTVLIIEHDMDVVLALADRITVLHAGDLLVEGAPSEVTGHPKVLAAYLGADGP
jgi:ABC-type branched-subunit amino acid transport system ATPase component